MHSPLVMAMILLLLSSRAAHAQADCGGPQFGSEKLLAGESVYAWSVDAADLDGDGDADVLSASGIDGKIAWYENAAGRIGPQHVISSALDGATLVVAADLDGDGDGDVLAGSSSEALIVWYENLAGHGSFVKARTITDLMADVSSISAADLDGDGDADVLASARYDPRIAWWENQDGHGDFGHIQVITTIAAYTNCALAADLDGDGDLDVTWCASGGDQIAWLENDGHGSFGPEHVIDTLAEISNPTWISTADLDGDGDLDMLSALYGEDRIAWYENLDGSGAFGPQQSISTSAALASCVLAADLDADGDADVLSASPGDDKVAWYENTDGLGHFGPQHVITALADGTRSARVADLDGDGSLDVVAASPLDDTVSWFANADGLGGFGLEQLITTAVSYAHDVSAADLDGDGDLDAITASAGDDKIAWYENLDGQGSFGTQRVVTTSADSARSATAGDIDGDGDIDLVSASFIDKTLAWYANLDGLGNFGREQVISTSVAWPFEAIIADLDGDGDADISTSCSAPIPTAKLAWFQNLDGLGTFGPPHFLTSGSQSTSPVAAADLDGDGDQDLAVVTFNFPTGELVWLENSGAGDFSTHHEVSPTLAGGAVVRTADIDADGDFDLLCCTNNDHLVMWFENLDGHGTFGAQQLIWTQPEYYPQDVIATDIDGDGDRDVVSVSWIYGQLGWYENTDGEGTFGPQQLVPTSLYLAVSGFAADLNGDGQQDLMYAAYGSSKAAWMPIRPKTSPLSTVGAPLPGVMGDPLLTGSSCLASNTELKLKLKQAAPDSLAFLVMGLSQLAAPLKGGVLIPFPDFVFPVSTGSHGTYALVMPLPANVPPGLDVSFQIWIVDPAGLNGFAASNGLAGVTQ